MSQQRSPTLAQVISDAIESRLFDLNVSLPAKVVAFYDSTTPGKGNAVDVQPLLMNRIVQDDASVVPTPAPIITNVPVVYPGGNGFRIQFDLAAGDVVLLVFSQRSLDVWLSSGGSQPVDPNDSRLHHLSDAVAIPGLIPFGGTPWAKDSGGPSIGCTGNAPRIVFTGSQVQLGGNVVGGEPVLRGTAKRTAEDALLTALSTALAAINTYAGAIQGIADPHDTATPTLATALTTTWPAAVTIYEADADAAKSGTVTVSP